MNDQIELKIIELIDEGATPDTSSELRDIIKSSVEAKLLYKNILASDKLLTDFFGGDKDKESKKLFKNNLLIQKSTIGFAIAASLAVIAFTFFSSFNDILEPVDMPLLTYEDTKPLMDEVITEPQPLYIPGEDMINGLWGPASKLAKKIGRDRYEIMYAIFKANNESFIDNNINQPKLDGSFFVDLSLVENLDTNFVIDEVKRHIFCSC
mgnify:FL=1|tara:strand:- start:1750 stop:2376 length:627 start_codon:yes stop_codon:yes gene_type:complete